MDWTELIAWLLVVGLIYILRRLDLRWWGETGKVCADRDRWQRKAEWLASHLKKTMEGVPFLVQRQGEPIYPTEDSPKRIIRMTHPTTDDILEAAESAMKDGE